MDALDFLKKWRALCNDRLQEECGKECPMYYDYCPMDSIHADSDQTLVSIIEYVERTGLHES